MEILCASDLCEHRRDTMRCQRSSLCQNKLLSSPWAFNWLLISLQLFSSPHLPYFISEPLTPAVNDIRANFHYLHFYFPVFGGVCGKISFPPPNS